ncbi:DNA binding protein [Salix suchowensis]|nr:DNA binding protein [Salix suchowensis]
MATPKQHIEHIRKNTFSIGGEKNPLAPMLDQAVKYLSAELYAKDVHFLMELIQNAEDNEYLEEVDPSLEFVITSRDITNTGAPATLLMFNNEKGFSAKNIESICNVGNSTKKGNRKLGYIGEKERFLIAAQPYIFSNGYQIRFNEKPCPHCNLGYIVPEWVGDNPFLLSHINKFMAPLLPSQPLHYVYDFADFYRDQVSCDQKLVIAYAHFLCHSYLKAIYSVRNKECSSCPSIESKWMQLIGSNPWRGESYIELGEDYLQPGYFAGTSTVGKQLVDFLKAFAEATDIPHISPPNAAIPTASTQLTKKNAFLLLDWIRELKRRNCIPERFMACIREGNWLKITMNGFPGYKPPSQSMDLCLSIFLGRSGFLWSEITGYWEELRTVGVMFEYGEACEFIGNHLMSLAASSTLTKSNVISILNFIKFLRQNLLSPDKFIDSIKEGRWLRTCRGDRSPVGSVLYDQEWTTARQISDIPFIDQDFYSKDILVFKPELQLLGVVVGFNGSYQLVAFLLVLDCMCHSNSAHKLVDALKSTKCLKTNLGYKCPGDCFLFHPEWGCLLKVFGGFPLVDSSFYGSNIISHQKELKDLGVKVDFEDAVKVFVQTFMKEASLSSITKDNVLSFLSCYRTLKETPYRFPSDLKKCIREVKWLRTRLGDLRSPSNCILFGPEWKLIHQLLAFPLLMTVTNTMGLTFIQHIAPENVLSLLQCIRVFLEEKDHSFPEAFLKNVSRSWLKTHAGFRSPGNCCLFNSQWSSHVRPTDGPFIDEDYYGFDIKLYSKDHLDSHSEFDAIVRVYDFLRENKWSLWSAAECIGESLRAKITSFFSSSFNVRSNPSFDDYCKLWKVWESLGRLTQAECCAFWKCACAKMQRSSRAERTLADDLVKLPVLLSTGEILLTYSRRLIRPIFVWCPQQNLPSLPRTRLLEVYKKIGVRTISESVLKEELSLADGVELSQMDLRDAGIGEELIRLILGFLAYPSLDMEATKRHGATMEPITVSYSLSLSDGEVLKVEASCMIRWDKGCSKFFTQKMDKAGGQKNLIEYATSFSEVIARGVLWDKEDQIKALSELIKLAFLLNFDEQAVKFLMKFNNLQTFLEDEEFLNAAFPSV